MAKSVPDKNRVATHRYKLQPLSAGTTACRERSKTDYDLSDGKEVIMAGLWFEEFDIGNGNLLVRF